MSDLISSVSKWKGKKSPKKHSYQLQSKSLIWILIQSKFSTILFFNTSGDWTRYLVIQVIFRYDNFFFQSLSFRDTYCNIYIILSEIGFKVMDTWRVGEDI